MANTYTKIYIQIIFAVKFRKNFIGKEWKVELYKYICGIVNGKNQKVYAINGMSDHIHILFSLKPDIALSDLVRDIKANSSKWVNTKNFVPQKFRWQEGFGAFSYSHSQLDKVIKYIKNQENHHLKRSFRNEYLELLKGFNVDCDERYVFEFYD